jgi:hypothetical protein
LLEYIFKGELHSLQINAVLPYWISGPYTQ